MKRKATVQTEPFSPISSRRFSRWGDEAADIQDTHAAIDRHPAAKTRRLASVAGVHPADMRRFLLNRASLTSAARQRIREWCRVGDSEIPRAAYEIPATTKPAKEGLR